MSSDGEAGPDLRSYSQEFFARQREVYVRVTSVDRTGDTSPAQALPEPEWTAAPGVLGYSLDHALLCSETMLARIDVVARGDATGIARRIAAALDEDASSEPGWEVDSDRVGFEVSNWGGGWNHLWRFRLVSPEALSHLMFALLPGRR